MMKKLLVLFIAAAGISAVYPQVKKGDEGSKVLTKADSAKIAAVSDTSKVKATAFKPFRSLSPSSLVKFNGEGFILDKEVLYKTDYRGIDDAFNSVPFGFLQFLGSPGLPHEAMIYGGGFGAISYNEDGIPFNNRLFNSFDLTNYQSEKISSVEFIPVTRGFLSGALNESSVVNFVTKDRTTDKQYSRIRFYQGTNKEGYIDFIFNMPAGKNFFVTAEVTNNSVNDRYKISDAGGWRGHVKLRYNVSDNLNFILNYNYINTEAYLNGGVDLAALQSDYPASWETALYDEAKARPIFLTRMQKTLNHSVALRALSEVVDNSITDLTLYYQTGLNEFRQNDTVDTYLPQKQESISSIRHDNKFRTLGIKFKQDLSLNILDLNFTANYEESILNSDLIAVQKKNKTFSVAASAGLHLFDSTFHPSIFAKNLSYNSNNYSGFGADINLSIAGAVHIYAGYSIYKKPYNVFEEQNISQFENRPEQEITTAETGLRYIDKETDFRFGYFKMHNKNSSIVLYGISSPYEFNIMNLGTKETTTEGLNARFSYKYWKILLSGNASSYLNRGDGTINIPSFTFDGGVYFTDTLFNKNLDLKAGFNFKYYTSQNYFVYDFEKFASAQKIIYGAGTYLQPIMNTPDFLRVDFFLAGRVQESAIVYFTYENIFNKKYFIVPYYPAMGRNIRFGISWEFLD